MISEILNTIFLTFLLTEYLLASNVDIRRADWSKRLLTRTNLSAALLLAVINVLERVAGVSSESFKNAFQGFLHAPKIIFAAIGYILALRFDCHRISPRQLTWNTFLVKVCVAFVYVLPVYPALAVLISFGFLLVINIFEMLHLNEDILNWPIYYGTLYGPYK